MIRPVSTRIAFPRPPATVTFGEGLLLAVRYWLASAPRWILPVVAVAGVNALASWFYGASVAGAPTLEHLVGLAAFGQPLPPDAASVAIVRIATGAAQLVASWWFFANAIAGLRGRATPVAWIVGRGIRAFPASVALVLLTTVPIVPMSPGLGPGATGVAIVFLPLAVAALYLEFRLWFWDIAVFDGEGVGAGLRLSWAISNRALMRIIGWAFGLVPAVILIVVVNQLVIRPLGATSPALGDGLLGGLNAALSAFLTVFATVLYESQRARHRAAEIREPAQVRVLDGSPDAQSPS